MACRGTRVVRLLRRVGVVRSNSFESIQSAPGSDRDSNRDACARIHNDAASCGNTHARADLDIESDADPFDHAFSNGFRNPDRDRLLNSYRHVDANSTAHSIAYIHCRHDTHTDADACANGNRATQQYPASDAHLDIYKYSETHSYNYCYPDDFINADREPHIHDHVDAHCHANLHAHTDPDPDFDRETQQHAAPN